MVVEKFIKFKDEKEEFREWIISLKSFDSGYRLQIYLNGNPELAVAPIIPKKALIELEDAFMEIVLGSLCRD